MVKEIVVASKNPVKINAARIAFEQMFPDDKFNVQGISAPSGVPDQPRGVETLIGATNRVENVSRLAPDADYWVGIEGGIEKKDYGTEAFAWMVVQDKNGKVGRGKSSTFILPEKLVALIDSGMELGKADDELFGQENSKQKNGTIGNLTNDIVTRTKFYETGMILALIPFKNPNLY